MSKDKTGTSSIVRTCLTVGLLLLSAGAYGAKVYLNKNTDAEPAAAPVPVKAEYVSGEQDSLDSVVAGTPVKCERAVKITQGEGYLRYNIQLLDSDGTPLDDKLQEKLDEKKALEDMADPEISSYRAFHEGICWATNDYNQLAAKGELVLNSFCRSFGDDVEFTTPCSEDNISKLTDSGELEVGFDTDDLVVLKNEEHPFTRTVIFSKKLSEGDVCPIYDHIILPYDWNFANTIYEGFMMNDEGDMQECNIEINNMELVGEGFGIKVTADVVDALDYPNAATAFKSAGK